MTKQEEIREGIAELEHLQWAQWSRVRNPDHPLIDVPYSKLSEKDKELDRVWAQKVLFYLHSKGIVIKVERELGFARVDGTGRELWYDGYKAAMDDYEEAGYVAVEPLIERT